MLKELRSDLRKRSNREKAKVQQRFFKTGPGEYAEGDVFLGVTVPESRKLAKQYTELNLKSTQQLLRSDIHEERLIALLILIQQYKRASETSRGRLYRFYVRNMKYVNNWDLVDVSAEHIVGAYLTDKSKEPLHQWAGSNNLWRRRIAMIATFHYIKRNQFKETLTIAGLLLRDEHDLIHKVVGWMLREVGKRDPTLQESFLRRHYQKMPRTMLRYAIERFPDTKRKAFLRGEV